MRYRINWVYIYKKAQWGFESFDSSAILFQIFVKVSHEVEANLFSAFMLADKWRYISHAFPNNVRPFFSTITTVHHTLHQQDITRLHVSMFKWEHLPGTITVIGVRAKIKTLL